MLDRFIWGEVERISPEAPVPVVRVVSESHRLGGGRPMSSTISVDLEAVSPHVGSWGRTDLVNSF